MLRLVITLMFSLHVLLSVALNYTSYRHSYTKRNTLHCFTEVYVYYISGKS